MGGEGMSVAVPGDSLADWVTYADWIVVATVTSESALDPNAREIAADEGLIARELSVRIDRTVFAGRRPDEPPRPFRFIALGWAFRDDEQVRIRMQGSAYLTVGRTYLLPIADLGPGSGWGPMDPDGLAEVIDGRLVLDDPDGALPEGPLADLNGLDLDEIEARLKSTAPIPQSEPFLGLPSRERFAETQAVLDAEAGYAPDGSPLHTDD